MYIVAWLCSKKVYFWNENFYWVGNQLLYSTFFGDKQTHAWQTQRFFQASPSYEQLLAWLPDFPNLNVPKRGKIYQIVNKLPNGHNHHQMLIIYSKWPQNTPTFSIPRPSKIYPNWDFWFEKIPSGNPGC
jgi:hypothetical protein